MLPDATILLQLRAAGTALLRYEPGNPHHDVTRGGLPGLKPGRPLPVPPFD